MTRSSLRPLFFKLLFLNSLLLTLDRLRVSAQWSNDTLLTVFQITRHGARYGLHSDWFNETSPSWRPGELTEIGKR